MKRVGWNIRARAARLAVLAVMVCGAFVARASPPMYGTVERVIDGDTLTVIGRTGARITVRLANIDAPELRQAYGQDSREALVRLAQGRAVRLWPKTRDRYGRTVGEVTAGDVSLGAAQVALGMAEVYAAYNDDPALIETERRAKAAGAGLWANPSRITPAAFRRMYRRRSPLWSRSCGGEYEPCAPKRNAR